MKIVLIAAKSDNQVIGAGNELAWHLPADLAFFYRQIENGFLLSGRKSYESEQGQQIFRDRSFVIVTRQKGYTITAENGYAANGVDEAISLAKSKGANRLLVLGGAEIYRQTIDLADELIITEVHTVIQGDAFFPKIDNLQWEEVHRADHQANQENPYDYSFVFFTRKQHQLYQI
ncbi:MAG TPA: dihydrofolate reductase [Saprospiraceae bacterium]|nr:dihydrofolate reductase [Saprospiraceae bacterium]HMQ84852.1 dihydrofolate reductase [Saprospiraceae bacterium]